MAKRKSKAPLRDKFIQDEAEYYYSLTYYDALVRSWNAVIKDHDFEENEVHPLAYYLARTDEFMPYDRIDPSPMKLSPLTLLAIVYHDVTYSERATMFETVTLFWAGVYGIADIEKMDSQMKAFIGLTMTLCDLKIFWGARGRGKSAKSIRKTHSTAGFEINADELRRMMKVTKKEGRGEFLDEESVKFARKLIQRGEDTTIPRPTISMWDELKKRMSK